MGRGDLVTAEEPEISTASSLQQTRDRQLVSVPGQPLKVNQGVIRTSENNQSYSHVGVLADQPELPADKCLNRHTLLGRSI